MVYQLWEKIDLNWHPTPVLLPGKFHGWRSLVGCSPWGPKSRTRLRDFTFTFHFHALEKEMATHSTVLAWRNSGTGEPGGLPSMGSHRVGHDWSDLAAAAAAAAAAAYTCILMRVNEKQMQKRPATPDNYSVLWSFSFNILQLSDCHFVDTKTSTSDWIKS